MAQVSRDRIRWPSLTPGWETMLILKLLGPGSSSLLVCIEKDPRVTHGRFCDHSRIDKLHELYCQAQNEFCVIFFQLRLGGASIAACEKHVHGLLASFPAFFHVQSEIVL